MLNVIDELQVVRATPTAMRDEKWMTFYKETYKPFQDLENQRPEGLNTSEMRGVLNHLFMDVGLVGAGIGRDMLDGFE